MGTRSAPLVFLLLTACLATDGTDPALRDGAGAGTDGAAAERPVAAVTLPAIPRMRPKPPRKPQPAATATAPSGRATATAAGKAPGDGGAPAPAAGGGPASGTSLAAADAAADAAATGETADRVAPADTAKAMPALSPEAQGADAAMAAPGDANETTETGLPAGVDASFGSFGTMAEPGSPPVEPGADPSSATDEDHIEAAFSFEDADDPAADLAAIMPPEPDRGIDVESLFDGDVVRYCAAMWQMGEYVGAARRRGEPFKQAIGDAVRRIAAEKQLPLDNRLAFSGQVYGRLVYRLEDSHSARTLGAYVHFACLTVRGDKKIVPADPNAERMLNNGLVHCENSALTRDALNDCIFRELTPIVDRRNG